MSVIWGRIGGEKAGYQQVRCPAQSGRTTRDWTSHQNGRPHARYEVVVLGIKARMPYQGRGIRERALGLHKPCGHPQHLNGPLLHRGDGPSTILLGRHISFFRPHMPRLPQQPARLLPSDAGRERGFFTRSNGPTRSIGQPVPSPPVRFGLRYKIGLLNHASPPSAA